MAEIEYKKHMIFVVFHIDLIEFWSDACLFWFDANFSLEKKEIEPEQWSS